MKRNKSSLYVEDDPLVAEVLEHAVAAAGDARHIVPQRGQVISSQVAALQPRLGLGPDDGVDEVLRRHVDLSVIFPSG